MKGKDLAKEVRLEIALECARYSDPITGCFIARGKRAIKLMFPDVSISTIKNIHRETKAIKRANPELQKQRKKCHG